MVSVDEPWQQHATAEIVNRSALAHRTAHLTERPDGRDLPGTGPDRLGEGAPLVHRPNRRSREDLHIHLPDRR
jgi:hypothetical protein